MTKRLAVVAGRGSQERGAAGGVAARCALAVLLLAGCDGDSARDVGGETQGTAAVAPAEADRETALVDLVRNSAGDDLARMTYATAWITTSLGVDAPLPEAVEDTLVLLSGQCGHRVLLLGKIADRFGLENRQIGFFNVPIQLGHSATEILIDGRWRFFDTTFGVYFSRPGETEPIGIAEARKRYPDIAIWQSSAPLWAGQWSNARKFEFRRIEPGVVLHPTGGWPVADIERTYFASMMAGAEEEAVQFSRIGIDLAKEPQGRIDSNGNPAFYDRDGQQVLSANLGIIGRANFRSGSRFDFRTPVQKSVRLSISYKFWGESVLSVADRLRRIATPDAFAGAGLLIDLDHAAPTASLSEAVIHKAATHRTALRSDGSGDTLHLTFMVNPPRSTLRIWATGDGRYAVVDNYVWQIVEDGEAPEISEPEASETAR